MRRVLAAVFAVPAWARDAALIHLAPLSAAAWLSGDDPAMTAIESHLSSGRSCRAVPDDGR